MLASVYVGAEGDPVFRYLPAFREAQDLLAAAVGDDRAVPRHVAVKSAEGAYYVRAGPQVEMVGVCYKSPETETAKIKGRYGLARSLGRHGHECRSLNRFT